MIEGIEQLRKDADICTQIAGVEDKFETVWITKGALLKDIEAIEREVEERYIEKPVDADGVTISPSDSMVDTNGKQFVVSSIEFLASGEWLVYANGKLGNAFAKLCHHYKPPTVEDVLEEFASAYDRIGSEDEEHQKYLSLISKFAAKLQLREEQ